MNTELIKKLMAQKSNELVGDLKSLVSVERKATGDILHYFYVVQRRRIYAEFNFPNIYKFSMSILGYTEHETQRRVTASRLLGEIPELEEKLNKGELSLTAVSMAHSLFNREHKAQNTFSLEKKTEVLKSFENKSVFECEREVLKFATVLPPPKEKVRNISEETVQITLNIPREFLKEIEALKNHHSHSNPGITTSELLRKLVKEAAQKKDPTREPRKSLRRTVSVSKQPDAEDELLKTKDSTPNKRVPASLKREVWRKNESCCSFTTADGKRCESRYQLEIDHIVPVALGGKTCLSNLRLLCKAHNQLHAINTLGFKKMDGFLNPH